jgi:Zn-dependent peptidase ImmA (M78 family)
MIANNEHKQLLIDPRHNLASTKLDAFSNRPSNHQAFVILGAEKKSAVRSRFDASHELAHLVLHRNVTHEDLNDKELFKRIEHQANRFAGSFLLPRATFLSEVSKINLDGFLSLKERWGAAVALMVKRCSDLELISPEASKRMWINIGRRGWRKAEPKDDSIEIENPRLIARSIEIVRNDSSGAYSELSSRLPWLDYEIKELIGDQAIEIAERKQIAPPEPRVIKFPTSG